VPKAEEKKKEEKPKVEKKEEKREKGKERVEKKEEKVVKTVEKAEEKVDKLIKFASEIRGKLVVVYGQPYAGKTTLVHALTKYFERTVYFKVDKNFSREDFEHIAKNVYYIDINSPQQLLRELRALTRAPPRNALIVVDSVTSLDSFFVPSDPTTPSPRMENARAKFADAVMQLLSFVKGLNTVIVIAHEKIRDFKTEEIVPRFNIVALRHSDANYRVVDENGKRKVKKVRERRRVEKPDFDFS
jgi:predicted ATP-dependent serine protease